MRSAIGLLLASILLLPACISGGDDGPNVEFVDDAESCSELADVSMILMQRTLVDLQGTSISDLTGEDRPDEIERYEDRKQAIRDRAGDIGCPAEEMQALIDERLDRLSANGPVPDAVLQELHSRGIFEVSDEEPTESATEPES